MSGHILFLAHRLPFPPDRGDKIRSHHVLKALAALGPVHVATFADSKSDWDHEYELADLAASHCLVERSKRLPIAGLEALLHGDPVSLAAFRNAQISSYVEGLLVQGQIRTIYVFSGQMGQYVPDSFNGRLIVDLVDVDSAKFEAYAQQGSAWMRWINAREGRLLRLVEDRLAQSADHILLVSDAEAELLRTRLSDPAAARVSALRNGIDTMRFDPDRAGPEPRVERTPGPHLTFTGQMDYPPNIAAAIRAAKRILPEIRKHYAGAELHIVGRAPVREVLALGRLAGVRVWGEVPDVAPFLASADIVTVPLEIARGVQNKVLEAMAMARPVVLTSGAATGIDAVNGTHFAVEDSDAALIARILALLANPGAAQAMGQAARKYVCEQQGWAAMLADLPRMVGQGTGGEGHRNAA